MDAESIRRSRHARIAVPHHHEASPASPRGKRKQHATRRPGRPKDSLSDSEYSCPSRFSLPVFERRLRGILGASASRLPGVPGSDGRPVTDDPSTFAKQYLLDHIMSKYDDGVSSEMKASAAYAKWEVAEQICKDRNSYFATAAPDSVPGLRRAKEYMYALLGPEVPLKRLSEHFGWGPGSSTRLTRRFGDACYKYSGNPEVTPNAYIAGAAAIAADPVWQRTVGYLPGGTPTVVWGSTLTTVPKNYKIDRVIAVEPDLNMYLQKGLGGLLRAKLKRVGIDLDDQTRNQFAARDFELATIDFSMASDSVSSGLVWYLTPANWSEWFDRTRSDFTVRPDGRLHRLQKISSMGNGYTFELESAIFYCLAQAVVPVEEHHRIFVYGDDVILPKKYAQDFLELASVAGFSPNTDKSFVDGPFRESCGFHCHSGYDVTPFYVRRPVKSHDQLFLLHNNLKRWMGRVDSLLTRTEWFALTSLLKELRSFACKRLQRPRIPDGYGDGAFIGSFAECSPRVHGGGWEYFVVYVLGRKSKVRRTEVPGLLVKSLYNLHKRLPVLPRIWEPTASANPSSTGRGSEVRTLVRLTVPWDAFG